MIDKETFINNFCKEKQREYYRAWREKNKEHIRQYRKKWLAKNKEKYKNYRNKEWVKQAIAEYERQTNQQTRDDIR